MDSNFNVRRGYSNPLDYQSNQNQAPIKYGIQKHPTIEKAEEAAY